MNGLFTSLWNDGNTAVATARQTALRCSCQPGVPCQCSTVCSYQQGPSAEAARAATLARSDLWAEAGEGELLAKPVVRGGPIGVGPAGTLRATRGPGSQSQRPARRASPRSLAQAAHQRQLRRMQLRRERQWLNHVFARRLGWGPHLPRIAALIGCGPCTPDSEDFLLALMRWQRERGLVASGVLTPGLWWRLRQLLAGSGPSRAPAGMSPGADADFNHNGAADINAQPHPFATPPDQMGATPGEEPPADALAPPDGEPAQPEWGWTGQAAGW